MKDNGISGVKGKDHVNWEANAVITKYSPVVRPVPERIEAAPKLKAKGGSEFYGLDFGAGVKAVFGIDINVKIGIDVSNIKSTTNTQ
jgi:hypothetical protein